MGKLYVYIFDKVTMEKDIVGIKLIQVPTLEGNKGKKSAYNNHLSKGSKNLYIIKTIMLVVTLGHQRALYCSTKPSELYLIF